MFPNNFLNKPFFIVNGGRDPLYPTTLVEPYIQQMIKGGVTVTYLPQPTAVHNTAWWPEVKDTYEAFVSEHPRHPFPDALTWESDLSAGTNRSHWLVIDRLSSPRADAPALTDLNDFVSATSEPNFGIRASGTAVTAVTAASNAAAFGLLPGDIIAKINDRTIPSGVDILDLLSIYDAGTKLILTVTRDGAERVLMGMYNPVAAPRVTPMFAHRRPSGRVDLVRAGNTVTATTRRVAEFTLLLSPEVFDFSKPVTVVADERTVFEGRVTKSVATLLKWAARDNDRTMLFAAELKVTLTP
jgi:membrane-associated protease RseP (regulator of RpoE activity)